MPIRKIGSLQIESEAADQNILFWRIQKLSLSVICLFLICVALGLTGKGILSSRNIEIGHGLSIKYDYFGRQTTSTDIQIDMDVPINSKMLQITFPKKYIDGSYVKQITPQPIHTEVKDNDIIYTFISSGQHSTILFSLEPLTIGFQEAAISISGSSPTIINQFIFP